jgi:Zn-dependent protease with chaperone function
MNSFSFAVVSLVILYASYFGISKIYAKRYREVNIEGINEIKSKSGINFSLRVKDCKDVNAFSISGNTVIITSSLLNLDKREVMAAIAHEVGHIKMKHHVKNLIIISIMIIGFFLLLNMPLFTLSFLLTGFLIQRFISRKFELEADKYAAKITSKEALISLLNNYGDSSSSILSTHPSSILRVKKI